MDYDAPLPPTEKQLGYARTLARRQDMAIPHAALESRRALSRWIDAHKTGLPHGPGATSRQVAFAERIARLKRRAIPEECFRDAGLMSRWIDANR
jgi:hypothetical protein